MKFHFIAQHDQMDCGPACLAMISNAYGKRFNLNFLREKCSLSKDGISLMDLKEAAIELGFDVFAAQIPIQRLDIDLLPCILHWNHNHFVILYKMTKNRFGRGWRYWIADPSHGLYTIDEKEFKASWALSNDEGVGLFLSPNPKFYEIQEERPSNNWIARLIIDYVTPFKKQFYKLTLLLLFGSAITLIFPLLTKYMIDDGVGKKNIRFIVLILFAQLFLHLGNIIFEIFRNWITLKVGAKININIISSFIKKLLNLPISFFDSRTVGDFNQRIHDQERIEYFLTSQSLQTLFSLLTFSVFFGVLLYYNWGILAVYIILTVLSIIWSIFWLKKRIELDYVQFRYKSEYQNSILELVHGISDVKLNQYECFKKNQLKDLQNKLMSINFQMLKVTQFQISGFEFLNQLKNIVTTFLAAYLVVHDEMTLGTLLSISYIMGQMNSPINQIVTFLRSLQDAQLSFRRLHEIQVIPDEESSELETLMDKEPESSSGIKFENVSFRYGGASSPIILSKINLFIPKGKVTAIVGASGSGKTTLMKLLLRFVDPSKGLLSYFDKNITSLSPRNIRENSGVVMQNGYIFSNTIERNIAMGDKAIDYEQLRLSVRIANLESFIDDLPLGFKTKIGHSGNELSGGQKQRILIARAVYKNPQYLFLDEATSALDADNEKMIHDNLQDFFSGRTVVIIAHRLSTVKRADQIIVLEQGKIVEQGNHSDLVEQKNIYYHLVKNQLELGQ